MNPILKNILAVVLGIVVGGLVNIGIIMISSSIIPPPEGVDVTNSDSLAQSMHLFGAKHFIFPFLAHAIGTLVGALVTFKIAANNNFKLALLIGGFFFIGGAMMVYSLPAPLWFEALDLILAYIPMAWIGTKIANKL